MSLRLSKSPIWVAAVVVGLVVATGLVAGYVDGPGMGSQVAAADGKCADCPKAGSSECCKVTGTCSDKAGCADGGFSGGTCAMEAAGVASCPVMAAAAAEAPATCASTSGCPAQAASASTCAASEGCGGGTCPVAK